MAWLFVPSCEGSPCAPVSGASTSDCTSLPVVDIARSVSWRGKLMRPRFWSLAWKSKSWLRRLSGLTSPHSTAQAGVDAWISSLRAIPVSRSAPPASEQVLQTLATCGRTWRASPRSAELQQSFWRTSPGICPLDSTWSPRTYAGWVSGLRRDYSQRLKWALRNDASDSSRWPTATASDTIEAERRGIVGNHNLSLPAAASRWPTPTATSCAQTKEQPFPGQTGGTTLEGEARRWPTPTAGEPDATAIGRGTRTNPTLADASRAWPTPSAGVHNDGEDPTTFLERRERLKESGQNGNGAGMPLAIAAQMWGTPRESEHKGTGPPGSKSHEHRLDRGYLDAQAESWPTPRASEGEKGGPNSRDSSGSLHLTSRAHRWATPTAMSGGPSQTQRGCLQRDSEGHTIAPCGPHDPMTMQAGVVSGPQSETWSLQCLIEGLTMWLSPSSGVLSEGLLLVATGGSVGEAPASLPGVFRDHCSARVRLNPLFVEWLMGWPRGWTDFAPVGMAWSAWERRMGSEYSRMS